MDTRMIISALLVAGFVTPALAHKGMMDFHIVQDSASKKCRVTKEEKPAANEMMISSPQMEYKSVEEASAAMKGMKECQ